MKKIVYICMLLAMLCGCKEKNNIYSDLLKAERELIADYIKREGIIVVTEEPKSIAEWGENVYWKLPDYDNFYFHLVSEGDTTQAEIESGESVLLRFKRYTLDEYADTLYNWTTLDNPEPIKLQYMVNSDYSCTGWQLAIKHMKYSDAQCKIICPSKLGFEEENSTVTPYGYELKIKIKRY